MRIVSLLCRNVRGADSSLLARSLVVSVAAVLLVAGPLLAEHTRWWRQSTFEDFDKGTAKGVALRSDGKLFSRLESYDYSGQRQSGRQEDASRRMMTC